MTKTPETTMTTLSYEAVEIELSLLHRGDAMTLAEYDEKVERLRYVDSRIAELQEDDEEW